MFMKTIMKGFTLIELMIVVAIIAILAAIALPAYQDYVIRSQVSEGAVLADGAKTAVAEFYQNNGRFPSTNASAGLATAASINGKYVRSVDVGATPGVIRATYSSVAPQVANTKINTRVLAFSAVTNGGVGSIAWHCGNTTFTTVPSKYLPTSCRGANQ
jgi:type IV pilus assembly protein PilA